MCLLDMARICTALYCIALHCTAQGTYSVLLLYCLWLQDKMEVGKAGTGMFELDPKGRPQVFYYGNTRDPASFVAHSHVSRGCQWMSCLYPGLVADSCMLHTAGGLWPSGHACSCLIGIMCPGPM
jgi:hypothetical protein